MIKRILLLPFFVLMLIVGGNSQNLVISPSDTVSIDTTLSSGLATFRVSINLSNTSITDTLLMKWRLIYNTMPHTWGQQLCQPGLCFGSIPVGANYTMMPGQNGSFYLDLSPNCIPDSPSFRLLTWAPSDSANTATYLTWKIAVATQNCTGANGIAETEFAQIKFYPNPVVNELKVTLPQSLPNGQIDIYDLIGSKVFSQPLNASKDFNVSALETGIYMARISENGRIIATKKFTKIE